MLPRMGVLLLGMVWRPVVMREPIFRLLISPEYKSLSDSGFAFFF